MRASEFRRLMEEEFGPARAGLMADTLHLPGFDATASDALATGADPREVWRASASGPPPWAAASAACRMLSSMARCACRLARKASDEVRAADFSFMPDAPVKARGCGALSQGSLRGRGFDLDHVTMP